MPFSFLNRLNPFASSTPAYVPLVSEKPVDAVQGPDKQAIREAQQGGELLIAQRCVGEDWWPRGLGLHVDDDNLRHELEPPEGARTWIQVERRPDGWSSEGTGDIQRAGFGSLTQGPAFLRNLLHELRMHVGSLDPAALKRLPRSGKELLDEFSKAGPAAGRVPTTRTLARPTAGRLSAGEVLSRRVPVDFKKYFAGAATPSDVVAIEGGRDGRITQHRQAGGLFRGSECERIAAAIQAETAQRLGAVLLQRFDWSRPITLESAPFKDLAKALEPAMAQAKANAKALFKSSAHETSWSLRAQSERGDVQLVLHTPSGERSLGTVLKAGPHAQGVPILKPQADDLDSAAENMARRHNGTTHLDDRFFLPPSMSGAKAGQRLAALDPGGRMIVHGHGLVELDDGKAGRVVKVGGKSPSQLARELIAEGLPRNFKGTIFLDACGSLPDATSANGFALRLRAALASKGYNEVSVATRPGVTWGAHGRARTLPDGVPPLPADLATPPEQASEPEVKLPRHRRVLNQLKSFLGFGKGPRIDDGKVNGSDPSGARHMWGHHGPATPTKIRDPRAADRSPR